MAIDLAWVARAKTWVAAAKSRVTIATPSPKRTQHYPTKADFPGPFIGFQMTIHATL